MHVSRKWLFFLACVLLYSAYSCYAINIDDSRYKGVLVSFSSAISDGDVNFEQLKVIISRSSEYLYHATKRRSYFSEFIFVLPTSGPSNICKKDDIIEHVSEVPSIYVHEAFLAKAQNSRGCGKKGDIIYMPLSWLSDNLEKITGHSRNFVQMWSTFRYGVFEETASSLNECFSPDGISWSPAGCYDLNITTEMNLDERGLPKCSFGNDFLKNSDIKSSIMFDTNPPNMTEFCGGPKYPHNPVILTRHNILCGGLPVWNVIENTEDFIHGKNPSKSSDFVLPRPSFKCYYETTPAIYIAVQDVSVSGKADIITEIRYVLHRFLLYGIPSSSKAVLLTYSDILQTDISQPYVLNLSDKPDVALILKERVRITDHLENVCIPCGLRKVIKVANVTKESGIIVFIAFISDLKSTSSVEMWEALKYARQKFNLIVIQDTAGESVSSDIVDAVRRFGGEIYVVSPTPVFLNVELNMILLQTYKSQYHLEADVLIIHQRTFSNIQSDFTDKFSVNTEVQGQLLYTLKCNDADRVGSSACASVDHLANTPYDCALIADSNTTGLWEFNFKYLRSPKSLTCVSLATLHLRNNRMKKRIVRGWLNEYKVSPKKEALVMYAEVLKDFEPLSGATVEAVIHPMALSSSQNFTVELFDNGNGDPDTLKRDGIYSRYLPFKFKKGAYSVMFTVKENCLVTDDDHSVTCTQYKNVPSFFVTEDFQELDIYPPSRVGDLTVLAVDHENSTVTLQWTAPGDDYDSGQASRFVVKYSQNHENLTEANFMSAETLQPSTNLSEARPSQSGTMETRTFSLQCSEADAVFFAALQSIDNSEKRSQISNIVQFFLRGHGRETVMPTDVTLTVSDSDRVTAITGVYTVSDNPSNNTDIIDGNSTVTNTLQPVVDTVMPTVVEANSTDKSCIDKGHFIMMASSIGGGCLLFIILINIIVCIICFKKKRFRSKRESMLPPHNLNMTYTERAKNQVSSPSPAGHGETEYDQVFSLQENITSAVVNANRLHWHRNQNYSDYREGRQVVPTPPRAPPPPTPPSYKNPSREYGSNTGLTDIRSQGSGNAMGSSESSNRNISIELGFV